jgi:K+-sensing histidine kinase KdpD
VNVEVRLVSEALRRLYEFIERRRRDDIAPIECSVEYSVPYVGLAIRCNDVELPPHPPARISEQETMRATIDEADVDLGLAVARTVAQLHGGQLTVEHDAATSICLTLWLPGVEPQPM